MKERVLATVWPSKAPRGKYNTFLFLSLSIDFIDPSVFGPVSYRKKRVVAPWNERPWVAVFIADIFIPPGWKLGLPVSLTISCIVVVVTHKIQDGQNGDSGES